MKLLMVGLNRKQQVVLHHVSTDSPFVNFFYKSTTTVCGDIYGICKKTFQRQKLLVTIGS